MPLEGTDRDPNAPRALLASAPLEKLLPYAQITRHAAGELIVTGDQLIQWVFCVLSGRCEEHRCPPGGEISVHHAFERGATFGGVSDESSECLGAIVVASEDSVLLRLRRDDLRKIEVIAPADTLAASGFRENLAGNRVALGPPPGRGKVVTLAVLSPESAAVRIGERIAQSLHVQTEQSVAWVTLVPQEGTVDWTLGNPATSPRAEGGLSRLRVGIPHDWKPNGSLAAWLDMLARRFDFVLLELQARAVAFPILYGCVAQSKSAYLFVRPDADEVKYFDSLLRELRVQLNSHVPVHLKPILCLTNGEPIHDFDAQLERAGLPAHDSVRAQTLDADVRRLARDISDRLVGLALSSGGAKGFAHIGVLQVLEENGIEVDIVTGASMGAYVGALWASGCDGPALEKLVREMEARWALLSLIDPVFPPRRGFMRGYALKRRLMRTIGRAHFAELPRSLRVVAANLNTQERTVFSSGEVAAAVHSSVAVPGICVPVPLGEESYVDGGIVDPLPVDVLQEMGVKMILAVNTIPTPERLRFWLQQVEREKAQHDAKRRPRWWRKLFPLEQHVNYLASGNILEILMRSVHGAQSRAAENACRRASLVIRPDICDDRWLDLRHPGKYLAAGREAALRQLDEIRLLVNRKVERHELESASQSLVAVA